MKFLHTADWQMGIKARHVGEVAPRVREERLNAARRVVEVAGERGADFLLLAGDVFEHNGVERVLIQQTVDVLSAFNKPVYIIPGNHDPFVPGSVWEHAAWKSSGNIHLCAERKPLSVPGGTLFPCVAQEVGIEGDPFEWILEQDATGIRIGMAHGSVEGIVVEEPYQAIPRDACSRYGLDYLALGHWHSTALYKDGEGIERTAYSGAHETCAFRERDSGNSLLVTINEPHGLPLIEKIRTGGLKWVVLDETIGKERRLRDIRRLVEEIDNADQTLLELRISGMLEPGGFSDLELIRDIAEARFLFSRIRTAVFPGPGDDGWIAGLPQGIVRETALELLSWANPGFKGRRPDSADPETATRALEELFSMIRREPAA